MKRKVKPTAAGSQQRSDARGKLSVSLPIYYDIPGLRPVLGASVAPAVRRKLKYVHASLKW
jgi:hypothetical protein